MSVNVFNLMSMSYIWMNWKPQVSETVINMQLYTYKQH